MGRASICMITGFLDWMNPSLIFDGASCEMSSGGRVSLVKGRAAVGQTKVYVTHSMSVEGDFD